MKRLRIAVEGVVQGVGFRPFVYGLAGRMGVRGFVANRAGDVVIEAEADEAVLRALVAEISARPPAAARVDRIAEVDIAPRGDRGFRIDDSAAGDEVASIPPDIATCEACLAEAMDPASRRAGYAFTSCAWCGPRLTIVTAAPYDRERTTMRGFPMCDACRAEHDDPLDRRFHAQPIACPACGPRFEVPDAIASAAAAIARGEIVALKGIGGYHLACDAAREDVVGELRARKLRDAKPFAVMVRDVAAADELVVLDGTARELLASAARPIVLAPRRPGARLALAVAPDVADVGVLLPYSLVHHLLLQYLLSQSAVSSLVMTSGNASDEPIAYRDDDARQRLAGIADQFVVHDRPIHIRCEDSVARVADGAPMILRRARGFAPAPIRVPFSCARPILALGGDLKAAFALGAGDVAYVSPHQGDLDELIAYEGYVEAIGHFARLHRVTAEVVACDLHPDYATSRLAESLGLPRVAVQHHHAHLASALADAGLAGPAIGVIFDGAGLGGDGTVWGGEILVGDARDVHRAAHLAPVALPGGDAAAREPWRMAVAHLVAAGESAEVLREVKAGRIVQLCERAGTMRTSSMGRLFDAVAALCGACRTNGFEGQAAMRLEALARDVSGAVPYAFDGMDAAPMIRAIVRDVQRDLPRASIAARFHATIVAMTAETCGAVARREGLRDVVLSGGVFQNAILANELPRRLRALGLVPHLHRRVPPNDGGLALGQLAVAAARLARGIA